jgi:hypothetical protein
MCSKSTNKCLDDPCDRIKREEKTKSSLWSHITFTSHPYLKKLKWQSLWWDNSHPTITFLSVELEVLTIRPYSLVACRHQIRIVSVHISLSSDGLAFLNTCVTTDFQHWFSTRAIPLRNPIWATVSISSTSKHGLTSTLHCPDSVGGYQCGNNIYGYSNCPC